MIEILHTHIKEKICLYLLRMDGGAYYEEKGITWNNRKYSVGKREDEIKWGCEWSSMKLTSPMRQK